MKNSSPTDRAASARSKSDELFALTHSSYRVMVYSVFETAKKMLHLLWEPESTRIALQTLNMNYDMNIPNSACVNFTVRGVKFSETANSARKARNHLHAGTSL
eukprot:6112933-Prymnesium_polylepis.1